MLYFIITLQVEHTFQGSRNWFEMILAQQFPSRWGNRPLLADLYVLSLHGLSEYETWRRREISIVNLPLIFLVLIETEMSSISIFSSNSFRKNGNTIQQTRLSLTFTAFKKVHNLVINF